MRSLTNSRVCNPRACRHTKRTKRSYATSGGSPRNSGRVFVLRCCWESLYSTVSRPFPHPTTGKIAVKVINHYGDEVLQVYNP